MPKIVTLTFNPAIDKSASVEALVPEKKLKCSQPKSEPGGGGINVARVLKRMGTQAVAIFPSGGFAGKSLSQLIDRENVEGEAVEVRPETRENFVIFEESTRRQFRFGMPAGRMSAKEWLACLDAVERHDGLDFIIVSGSLPPGVPVSVMGRLAAMAKRKKAKLVADTSGEALKELLSHEVYLLKPNLAELAEVIGDNNLTAAGAKEAAEKILLEGRCEVIVVSLGNAGALLATKDQTFYAKPPKVEAASTVGAGDSLVAGVVHALASGYGYQAALNFGVACGTATTMTPGTGLCQKRDVERLFRMMEKGTGIFWNC